MSFSPIVNPACSSSRRHPSVRARNWIAALTLAVVCGQPRAADLDALLPAVRAYHFGADRAPLAQVEALVQQSLGHPAQKAALAAKLAPLLATDAPYNVKQFVCRQLVLTGGDAEVPALAALLTDADEHLAHLAVFALARNPSPRATAALLDALAIGRGSARLNVIAALGRRPAPGVAAALNQVADDPDSATREAALAALGRLGIAESRRALARRLSTTPAPAPAPLTEAALNAAEFIHDRKAAPAAGLTLLRLLEDSRQTPRVQAAALGVRFRRGLATSARVLQALVYPSSAVRREAARLLYELPPDKLAVLPPEAVRGLPLESRRALLGALVTPAAAPLALALTRDADPTVQRAAVEALGRLRTGVVVPDLVKIAATSKGELQAAARHSLGRITDPAADRQLLNRLKASTNAAAQREIILALADRSTGESTPALRRLAVSAATPVRVTALRALRDIAPANDLPALLDLLAKVDDAQAGEAEAAVAAVARRASDPAAATRTVLDRLEASAGEAGQGRLLRVLGSLNSAEALSALRVALHGADGAVRLTALRVLSEWPDAAPLADLRRVVSATADSRERSLALRGLVRMVGLDHEQTAAARFALLREAWKAAGNEAEQRLVIGGLGSTPVKAAFDLARKLEGRAALRAEAQAATVQLGRALAGAFPQEIRAVMERIAAAPAAAEIGRQAAAVIKLMDGFDGFVTAWEVSPAYVKAGLDYRRLFDVPFPPEPGGPGGAVSWQVLPAAAQPKKPWMMDLLAVHPGLQRVAYARTRVWSADARDLVLEIGSDDGVKLWVNGALVHANNAVRGAAPGQEKPRVKLRAGWNDLLLKITQNIMGWEFCAKFVEPDGSPALNLRCALPGQK